MAVVQGIREKVHLPIYDSVHVERGAQLIDVENSSTLKFFVDVQRKTKLETNLQSASLLPHYDTFEARAMRVVISDLPPDFSEEVPVDVEGVETEEYRAGIAASGKAETTTRLMLKTDLKRAMELLEEARESEDGSTIIYVDTTTGKEDDTGGGTSVTLTIDDL